MYNICINYSNDRDDAKDIMQDGFIKVFNTLKQFNNQGSLEGWIRKIMVNTAIDFYRKKSKERTNLNIENAHNMGYESPILENINTQQLIELTQKLPEGAKLIFNLYALEGYSHEEIAKKLDISIGTSKSQVSRAKTLLKSWINKFSSAKISTEKA